ncbi:MAG TPA: peptidoglycan-binding protein [Chthoniobacterales bacterium]|nr:peptidoglycan-binding protein [Chthoniobacterales bacterium]HXY60338.1 peptidoglycan-binding protein [Chthoniobacterales bacterium]
MKIKITAVMFLAGVLLVRADEQMANVQQALKEQGFYYGEISGEKSADTSAAIRRFQIRNGLQVTGELNDETLHALDVGTSSGRQLIAKTTPAPTPDNSTAESESHEKESPANPVHEQEAAPSPGEGQIYPGKPMTSPEGRALFAGTPYETASPEVQHSLVMSAQDSLARRGLYRNAIDGIYGPNMEFSLRAYQSRVGLPTTGRLDLETLAALELLPGAHAPVYSPQRRVLREPPVRGQWIHE